jgi:hypothetical protein
MDVISRLLNNPFDVAQRHFAGTGNKACVFTALNTILDAQLWLKREEANGQPFDSFAMCAIAPRPHGLEIRSQKDFELLRFHLMAEGKYAEWIEVLEATVRGPGRPKKNTINSGDSIVYVPSPSPTATDNILRKLKDHPDIVADLIEGKYTVYQGGIRAGVVRSPGRSKSGPVTCDFSAALQLPPGPQFVFLRDFFLSLPLNTQCTFIARVLEPGLHRGLAKHWRDLNSKSVSHNP